MDPREVEARSVALRDARRSLLIEAGAGSGKTTLMAGRIVRMLADGVAPERIAAITFTEAAASHLRNKVATSIAALLADAPPVEWYAAFPGPLTASERGRLREAEANLDALACSTIHAFARSLTIPYPVEADLDPGAAMLDPARADEMFAAERDRFLRGEVPPRVAALLASDPRGLATIVQLTDVLRRDETATAPPPADPAPLRAEVGDALAALAGATAHPFAPDAAVRIAAELQALVQALDSAADDVVRALLLTHRDGGPSVCFTTAGAFRSPARAFPAVAWEEAARAAGATKAVGKAAALTARDAYARGVDALTRLGAAVADRLLGGLLDDLRVVAVRFRARKRAEGLVDPDDLLRDAAALLRRDDAVRRAWAERYPFVLIDEFQDTDPLQAEIVWRLTGEPAGADWRDWPSRRGARFVVGDPKQSIYRFRRADVETYQALRERVRADPNAAVLGIATNFRSLPEILAFTNATFAPHFEAADQPTLQPLAPHRASVGTAVWALDVGASDPDLDEVALASDDERSERAIWRDLEAEAVARAIVKLLAHGWRGAAVRARDVALLSPAGAGLERYEWALERRGLAVASQAGKSYFQQQITHDLLALVRALADPGDTLALNAFLRGPLVGVPDAALLDAVALLRRADEGAVLDLRVDPERFAPGPLRTALTRLRQLAAIASVTPPHALLHRAVAVLEIEAIVQARHLAAAARDRANLSRFLVDAKAFERSGLRAYARHVWRAWAEGRREREAPVDVGGDAVTLMTVHSAKGLEWPVVVPVNAFLSRSLPREPLLDRDAPIVHAIVAGLASSAYEARREEEGRHEAAERLRLWYVATTRARDLLLLPRVPEGDDRYAHLPWDAGTLPAFDAVTAQADAMAP